MVPRSQAALKVRRGIRRGRPMPIHAIAARTGDNRGMDIVLNGDSLALGDGPTTILDLLSAQDLTERRVAVEVNGEIVPRGRHAAHVLREGDRVEIVHALGGG